MGKKKPSFIRIRYKNPSLFLLAGLATASVLALLLFLLNANRFKDNFKFSPIFLDPRNYLFFLNPNPSSNSQPSPAPSELNLSPTPTPLRTTPPRLETSNINLAQEKAKLALLSLQEKNLPSQTVRNLILQGESLLKNGHEEEALNEFRRAYNLAQEILLAAEFYIK